MSERAPASETSPATPTDPPAGFPDLEGPAFAFERFFLPGPSAVRPEVRAAMRRPVMGHRTPEMKDLLGGLQDGLRALFETSRPVYVSTSSATGLMEAAVVNLARRRILCLVCGAFSGRFAAIAEATGRAFDTLEVPWGRANDPDRLADRLAEEPGRYDLVTAVHSETSTGVLNPVDELAEVVAGHEDVLLAVDGVSSVAGAPVEVDAWGVDFLLTGSQKALALPPGLSLAVASERALERAEGLEGRSRYFDLLEFERRIRDAQTPNTPVLPLIYALHEQLGRIADEGLEERWARHERMARRTRRWAEGAGGRIGVELSVLAPPGRRSPTVTAVELPEGIPGREVAAGARERGYTIAPGYGKLKDATIRIGHMGDHTVDELDGLLEALDEELEAIR